MGINTKPLYNNNIYMLYKYTHTHALSLSLSNSFTGLFIIKTSFSFLVDNKLRNNSPSVLPRAANDRDKTHNG